MSGRRGGCAGGAEGVEVSLGMECSTEEGGLARGAGRRGGEGDTFVCCHDSTGWFGDCGWGGRESSLRAVGSGFGDAWEWTDARDTFGAENRLSITIRELGGGLRLRRERLYSHAKYLNTGGRDMYAAQTRQAANGVCMVRNLLS